MIMYALVDPESGVIVQVGALPDMDHLALQAQATGMLALELPEGVAQESHRWDGTAFVLKTE